MKRAKAILCVIFVVGLAFLSGCLGKRAAGPESFPEHKGLSVVISGDAQTLSEEERIALADKESPDSGEEQVSEGGGDVSGFNEKPGLVKQLSDKTGPDQPGMESEIKHSKPYTIGKSQAMSAFSDPQDKEGTLTFNFDDADLYDVIRLMADMLHFNYIVDPGVSGKVTIHTSGTLEPGDLLPLFHQILELNGMAAVQEGKLVKIIKAADVPKMPAASMAGGGRVIQIIPLRYVLAEEMAGLLKPFLSSDATLVSDKGSNLLIMVERKINIPKLLQLVEVFDIDLFENLNHRFYQLMQIEAEEAVKLLDQILGAEGAKELYTFIPITRLNKILAICKKPRRFDKIDELITIIDEENNLAEPQIYVYKVRNGQAEELSGLLNSIFQKEKKAAEKNIPSIQAAAPAETKEKRKALFPTSTPAKQTTPTKKVSFSADTEGSGTLKEEVKFVPDVIRNAIIIQAIPSDYRLIQKILEQVDILPRQVLIEVVIAEIRLNKNTKFGVEWQFDSQSNSGGDVFNGTAGAGGLKFNVGWSDKIDAELSAEVEDSDVNIISSPRLLASDNKEASINISNQTPVATTTYNYDDTSSNVFETDIQYKETGIILSFTPHINDRGLVSMEINQEVSDEAGTTEVLGEKYARFSQRKVSTSLTVKDGQTIVIGGLMFETDEKSNIGVPFLAKLPIIGFLFGQDSDVKEKNELIILIKPSVIKDLDDIDAVTSQFKKRVSAVTTILGERNQPDHP